MARKHRAVFGAHQRRFGHRRHGQFTGKYTTCGTLVRAYGGSAASALDLSGTLVSTTAIYRTMRGNMRFVPSRHNIHVHMTPRYMCNR